VASRTREDRDRLRRRPDHGRLSHRQSADALEQALGSADVVPDRRGGPRLEAEDGRYTIAFSASSTSSASPGRAASASARLTRVSRVPRRALQADGRGDSRGIEPRTSATGSSTRQQGDREALEELYLLHFDRIYSYLHMSVGNRHDAEDLTTQTFMKMLESIKRFRWQSAPFSAWLFRIAHNLAMDHFRASRAGSRRRKCPSRGRDGAVRGEAAFQSIGRESMLELIEHLSQEQQQVLTLKFVFNLPNAEVATILDKSEGAIKSLQHRALVSLQKQITQS
jgi:RNA polymerase sigma-70 factor (ECF subfamily)